MACVGALVAMLARCQRTLQPPAATATGAGASTATTTAAASGEKESEADDGVWRRLEQAQRATLLSTGQRIASIALSSSELLGALLTAVRLSSRFPVFVCLLCVHRYVCRYSVLMRRSTTRFSSPPKTFFSVLTLKNTKVSMCYDLTIRHSIGANGRCNSDGERFGTGILPCQSVGRVG
jgi:hypothetical protein